MQNTCGIKYPPRHVLVNTGLGPNSDHLTQSVTLDSRHAWQHAYPTGGLRTHASELELLAGRSTLTHPLTHTVFI